MTTATAAIDGLKCPPWAVPRPRIPVSFARWIGAAVGFAASLHVFATPESGSWQPIFQGIDHLAATNVTSGGDFNHLMVANILRIDLQNPGVRLLSTPRIDNYVANERETAGRTVSRFLETNQVQVAINGTFFSPSDYYLPDGTPMTIRGLAISEGTLVSSRIDESPVLLVDALNHARIVATNSPAAGTADVYTAITGDYPLVVNGVNIGRSYLNTGGFVHEPNPRTAAGLSQDRRFLYFLAIDGRQPGYSDGAYDYETGAWLKWVGAYDGLNLDGGGSTTMVMQNSLGRATRLNRSSAVADSGKERTVGSHLGVFAKTLTTFVDQVTVQPDDTSAVIKWTTAAPASTQVEYGLTVDDLGLTTPLLSEPTVNHQVLLTGLKPGTGYFFRAVSLEGARRHVSPNLSFTTTNYATVQVLIHLTDPWKFTVDSQDGRNWTAAGADESGWSGPGNGLLWADVRSTGPNPAVEPKGEPLPVDSANSGFPYPTYYFRHHFNLTGKVPGIYLSLSAYVDDGAVFYLNGHEIQRLRMEDAPAVIDNSALSTGFPCNGDATCTDDIDLTDTVSDWLLEGDNVLAVEVHNYNPRSADITFGLTLSAAIPRRSLPVLGITTVANGLSLSWSGSGFVLQHADSANGPWIDLPATVASPFVTAGEQGAQYFRLRR